MKKFNLSKIILVIMFFIAGCATLPEPPAGGVRLQDLCDTQGIMWGGDNVSGVITLDRGDVKAKALIGSDVVIVGTESVKISGVVQKVGNDIYVPGDFHKQIISLFVPAKGRKTYKIIIDPGHGGKDPGAIGRTGLYEKKVALDISQRLGKILVKKNFEIKMTRNTDKFISLAQRTEIASKEKADLFISVHANAAPSHRAYGVEVYALRTLSAKEEQEDQRSRNQWIMFNEMSMEKGNAVLKSTVSEMLSRYKKSESDILAIYVNRSMLKQIRSPRRGVKRAGFFVLRNNLMPSILVEVGFLSNLKEEKLLKRGSYRQKVAESIADGVISYINRK